MSEKANRKLIISQPESSSKDKLGHQHLTYLDESNNQEIIDGTAYLDSLFYGFSWTSPFASDEFITILEETLQNYENNYPVGASALQEETEPDEDDYYGNLFFEGMMLQYRDENNEVQSTDLIGLERPLDWEEIKAKVPGEELTWVRINTRIGDFFMMMLLDESNVAALTHVIEVDGLADLVSITSGGELSKEEALKFLETQVSLFNREEE